LNILKTKNVFSPDIDDHCVPKDTLFDEAFLTKEGKLEGPLADSIDDLKNNVPSLEASGGGKGKESGVGYY
jgi:hypothetical protein